MKSFKDYAEGIGHRGAEQAKSFHKMSDKELKKWLETNWSDEPNLGKVYALQLKNASKEANKRRIKWSKK
jgi:hypothetical protein